MSNTPTPALELEVMPPEVAAVSTELSAPKETALAAFTPFQKLFAESALLLAKEKDAITPKDARKLRLEMRAHRSACKQTKDAVKADILLAGRMADAYFNRVTQPLDNAEARLDEIEKAAERVEAARKEKLKAERTAELAQFGVNGQFYSLENLPDADYAQLLAQSKLAHETKLAAEAKAKEDARIAAEKAEEERKSREAAELAERERIKAEAERLRIENERLAKEREVAEAAAKAEREKIEAAAREAAEVARKEKEAAEAKAAAELKAAQEKAKQEREAIEAKARAEAEEAARVAKIEREKREALERAEAERVAAEQKRIAEEKSALARAAAAPDRDKLAAIGVHITQIQWPEMETEDGKLALRRIKASIATVTEAIRTEYKALGKEATK